MIKRFLLIAMLSFGAAGAANALDIDVTDHPDLSKMMGYGKVYKPDCEVFMFYSKWETSHLMGIGECGHVSEEQVMSDLAEGLANIKSAGVDNFRQLEKTNLYEGLEMPAKYWDFMSGYQYEYSKDCKVEWSVGGHGFMVPESCPEISQDKLKSDAIKSIEYVKANSNARDFADYYWQLEKKQKTQNQGYTIEDSRVDAVRLWGAVCQNRKDYRTAPRVENPMTLEWVIHEFYRIDKKHVATLYHHAVDVVEQYRGRLDCLNGALQSLQHLFPSTDIRAKAYK